MAIRSHWPRDHAVENTKCSFSSSFTDIQRDLDYLGDDIESLRKSHKKIVEKVKCLANDAASIENLQRQQSALKSEVTDTGSTEIKEHSQVFEVRSLPSIPLLEPFENQPLTREIVPLSAAKRNVQVLGSGSGGVKADYEHPKESTKEAPTSAKNSDVMMHCEDNDLPPKYDENFYQKYTTPPPPYKRADKGVLTVAMKNYLMAKAAYNFRRSKCKYVLKKEDCLPNICQETQRRFIHQMGAEASLKYIKQFFKDGEKSIIEKFIDLCKDAHARKRKQDNACYKPKKSRL